MSAAEVIKHLLALDAIARDPSTTTSESSEATFEMHKVVQAMKLSEIEDVLMALREHPRLDPDNWVSAGGLAEALLGRLADHDMQRAVAVADRMAGLSILADALSRKDPMAAAAFMREHGIMQRHQGIAAINIGRFAAAQGPEALLLLEDVLGSNGIDDALDSIPKDLCKNFADHWYRLHQENPKSPYYIRSVMERWVRVEPDKALEWYRSKPDLSDDVQLSYSMMNILLHADEKQGLDFAEAEFQQSPLKRHQLFGIAVNSYLEPEMWVKLAERMPKNAKPTLGDFSEHMRVGRAPGPDGIAAAARCIADNDMRYSYLISVLNSSKGWSSRPDGWKPAVVAKAREELESLLLTDEQRIQVLKLYDEVASKPLPVAD